MPSSKLLTITIKMSDLAYGYYSLQLFQGNVSLPLKLCLSYPTLKTNVSTKCGIDKRPVNRVYVLAKKECNKIKTTNDIEKVVEWDDLETYFNNGTSLNPDLVSLDKFPGVKELLDQNKLRTKERDIEIKGIYPLIKLVPRNYNGKHYHSYPYTQKDKEDEKSHNIYRLLAVYLKLHESFVLCTFFSRSGEEIGALYEEDGILKLAGLYADIDLKQITTIKTFPITKVLQKLVNGKFDKLKKEDEPNFVLEWRQYMFDTLECKGVRKDKKTFTKKNVNEIQLDKDLKDLFEGL
jgi:hypothetical protein